MAVKNAVAKVWSLQRNYDGSLDSRYALGDKPAPTLPTWLTTNVPATFTWYEIPNSSPLLAMTSYSPPADIPKTGAAAYSGAAFKAAGSEILLVANGGHSDYAGNEAVKIALGLNTVAPELLRAPTAVVGAGNVSHYGDGRPASRHTGWDLQYIAARDRVFLMGAVGLYGGSALDSTAVDAFNLATNDYDAAGTWAAAPALDNVLHWAVQDADGNVWVQSTAGATQLHKWTQATATWSTIGTRSFATYLTPAVFDPVRNRIVRIHPTAGMYLDLSAGAAETAVSFSGAAAGYGTGGLSAVWCAERGTILTMPWNAAAVYEIDPVTWVCSALSLSGSAYTPATPANNYLCGRFGYAPELKLAWVLPSYSHNVWCFRVA